MKPVNGMVWLVEQREAALPAGPVLLRGSVDGGPLRRASDTSSTALRTAELARASAQSGWLLSQNIGDYRTRSRALLATYDSGERWRERPIPCDPISTAGAYAPAATPFAEHIFQAAHALWLTCTQEPATGQARTLFRSTDGGATWLRRRDHLEGKNTSLVAVLPSGRLLVSRRDDGLYAGARRVATDESGRGFGPAAVLDASHVWVVAANNTMWRTSDGTHWSSVRLR